MQLQSLQCILVVESLQVQLRTHKVHSGDVHVRLLLKNTAYIQYIYAPHFSVTLNRD